MIGLKIIGCIFIICSCTGMGMHFSAELRNRINDLMELKKLIHLLKGDIRYVHSPLPEAIQTLSIRHDGKLKEFLKYVSNLLNEQGGVSFYSIWKVGVETKLSHTSFIEKDFENLIRLGESLGYLDKEVQLNTLDLYIQHLEEEISELTKSVKEKSYMYHALGIMGGLFVVIIMV